MQPAALSRLRTRLPACELAAYVDIGAGTVLAADGALAYPQEYLDALCTCAAMIFGATCSSATDASAGPAGIPDTPVDYAVFSTPTGLRAFVRPKGGQPDVICLICGHGVDLLELLEASRAALADLTRPELQPEHAQAARA